MHGLEQSGDFDNASPLFPGNTQLNLVFKRRKIDTLLNYLLYCNLDLDLGPRKNTLTPAERETAMSFSVTAPAVAPADPVVTEYEITGMEVIIKDMFLQVRLPPHSLS
jgi:hypothetical protein